MQPLSCAQRTGQSSLAWQLIQARPQPCVGRGPSELAEHSIGRCTSSPARCTSSPLLAGGTFSIQAERQCCLCRVRKVDLHAAHDLCLWRVPKAAIR